MRRESRPNWSKFKNYPFVLRCMEGAKRGETRFTQTGTANKTPCLGVTLWEETTSEMQNIAPIQNPERIRAMSIIPHTSSMRSTFQHWTRTNAGERGQPADLHVSTTIVRDVIVIFGMHYHLSL